MIKVICIYLIAVNVLGALVTAWDKYRASSGGWRVRERTLFLWCIVGGCPGVYAMMKLIRHKTKHKRFMLGIPLIFVLQLALIGFVWFKLHSAS